MKEITTKLMELTGRSEEDCKKIDEVLNNHFIVGHNQKDKIKNDLCSVLGIEEPEADDLYNKCMEVIVKGIFRK